MTGALGAAVLNLADRVPAHLLVAVCALVAAGATAAVGGLRRTGWPPRCRCVSSPASRWPASTHRAEADDVVVRPRARVRPRRAGRCADAGQRAPPADQLVHGAAVAGGAARGRGPPRRAACSRRAGPARPARRARTAVPPAVRRSPCSANAARGWPTSATSATCGSCTRCGRGCPPTWPRAPRPPVAAARRRGRLPRDRGRRGRRVPARRLAGRPGRAGAAGGARDGGQRNLLRRWPPFAFGGPPPVVLALALVWGAAVIADSGLFSACTPRSSTRATPAPP